MLYLLCLSLWCPSCFQCNILTVVTLISTPNKSRAKVQKSPNYARGPGNGFVVCQADVFLQTFTVSMIRSYPNI